MIDIFEKAEKLVGRKLKPTEKFLVEQFWDSSVYEMGVDGKGDIIFNKKF